VTDLWWFEYLAELYRTAGDHEREARVLDRAIQKLRLHPSTLRSTHYLPQAYEKLAAACIKFGDTARAKKYLKKKKTISLVVNGHGSRSRIAHLYMQYEMWAEAKATYTQILKNPFSYRYNRQQEERNLIQMGSRMSESKTDVAPTPKLGQIGLGMRRAWANHYKDRGKTNEAIELFEQIAERMPEDLESRAQLAEVYTRQKKYDKAFAEWRGLLKADPENTKFQGGFVAAQEAAGNIEHAIQLLKNYIDSNGFTMHYPQLAELYVKTGRVDEAISAYQKAIEINLGDGSLHQKVAQLYLRIEDFGAAEEAFHQVLRSNEDSSAFDGAENQLIQLYLRQDKLEEKLKQAEQDGTLTFRMQKKRAEHYRDQGELKKAAKAYRKALKMPTRSWRKTWISGELATIYARLGQTKSAVEQYERLYHASPQEGLPSMRQSMTASDSKVYFKRDAQAREEAQELQTSTSMGTFSFYFGSLDEADDARHSIIKVYRDAGKLKTLLAYIQKRSKTNPENPALFEIIADIHYTRGDDAKAAMYYQRVCELLPTNVRSFYYAAAHLNNSNQPERAQAMLDKGEIARARCADGRWNRSMWGLAALGSICIEGGLYDTAIELLQTAIANQKKSEPILYHMAAQACLELERYAEAIDAFQKMEGASKDDRVKKVAQEGMRKARRERKLPDQSISEETQIAQ
jgi:tetratricopeptide (TPR) repeat protein